MTNKAVFSDSLSHISGAFLPALSGAENDLFGNASPNILSQQFYSQFILFTN
jgi:hypothetical protein